MRKSLQFILLILLFTTKVNAQITITGQIKNAPDSTEVLITYWNNPVENIAIVLGNGLVDETGFFSYSYDLKEKRFGQFIVDGYYLDMFFIPGDTIKIDAEYHRYFESIQFKSKVKNELKYLLEENNKKFDDKFKLLSEYQNAFTYKAHVDSIENQHLNLFYKHQPSFNDHYFKEMVRAEIKYKYIYKRFYYGIRDFKFEIPISYYSFIDSIDINADNLIHTSRYNQCIEAYIHIKCSRNIPNLSNLYSGSVKDKENVLLIKYNYIKNTFSGEVRDVRLSNFVTFDIYDVRGDSTFMNNLLVDYLNICSNTVYKNYVNNYYNKRKNITNSSIPNFEFIDIYGEKQNIHSLKGKYIYIDFWATWCYPCLLSMKDYPTLQEKYKNRKDIVYLFINIMDEKDKWSSYILNNPKYGISWFADKPTTKKLSELFEINGIPRYVLIDKNLRIIDSDADFPKKIEINQ